MRGGRESPTLKDSLGTEALLDGLSCCCLSHWLPASNRTNMKLVLRFDKFLGDFPLVLADMRLKARRGFSFSVCL